MEHIISEPRGKNPTRLIHSCQVQCLIVDPQEFCTKIEDLRVLQADRLWSGMDFYGDDFGKHRTEESLAEVFHETVRPRGKLHVEAATDD